MKNMLIKFCLTCLCVPLNIPKSIYEWYIECGIQFNSIQFYCRYTCEYTQFILAILFTKSLTHFINYSKNKHFMFYRDKLPAKFQSFEHLPFVCC